jgi:hypothetical protein
MAEETIEQTSEQTAATAKKQGAPRGLSNWLSKVDEAGEMGFRQLLTHLPFVLFLVVLAVLHIANNHLADHYVRSTAKTEKELKNLRWEYMTTTADLMKQSRQSEVAKLVEPTGIKPLRIPPNVIERK